ncbi:hypothetical protein BGZ94_001451, partial [Podila epigama]
MASSTSNGGSGSRYVASIIIKPTTKRDFSDAPEPRARRSFIDEVRRRSTHLDTDMNHDEENKGQDEQQQQQTATTTTKTTTNNTKSSNSPSHSSLSSHNTQNPPEASAAAGTIRRPEKRSRPTTFGTGEDAQRGKRMMGMILGTLSRFKKETTSSVNSDSLLTTTTSSSSSTTVTAAGGNSKDVSEGGSGSGTNPSSSSTISLTNVTTATTTSTTTTTTTTTAPPKFAGGISSREALQARVREKLEREKRLHQELDEKERQEREKLRAERQKLNQERRALQQQQRLGGGARGVDTRDLRAGGVRGFTRHLDSRDGRRAPAPRWTGTDYILTETQPRLRYLPKVLNETLKQKLEDQSKERATERERHRDEIQKGAPSDPRSADTERTAKQDSHEDSAMATSSSKE